MLHCLWYLVSCTTLLSNAHLDIIDHIDGKCHEFVYIFSMQGKDVY